MFELVQLEQLIAIEKYLTISKAAENLNLSQPALSRSMQRLEEELQVPLFTRQKNKLSFNENGLLALDYAKRILRSSKEMKEALRAHERSLHTISIGSCAPAPLWILTPAISQLFSGMAIQSEMNDFEELEEGLLNEKYQIIITTKEANQPGIICRKYCEEHLYVSLPPAHPLSERKSMALADLNGLSILILSKLGFWFDICKKEMPDSMFLVQEELSALNELRRSSALPTFATNLTRSEQPDEKRIFVPVSDPSVNVTFYLHYLTDNKKQFQSIKQLPDIPFQYYS